ncbi:MAG: hypothetical protein ACOH1X_01210 [Kaistella sp.]
MKKILGVILVMFFSIGFAQDQPENRFNEAEQEFNQDSNEPTAKGPVVAYGPGNPGEPVPIDDYIPLLIIAAVGIIVYKSYTKNKALS